MISSERLAKIFNLHANTKFKHSARYIAEENDVAASASATVGGGCCRCQIKLLDVYYACMYTIKRYSLSIQYNTYKWINVKENVTRYLFCSLASATHSYHVEKLSYSTSRSSETLELSVSRTRTHLIIITIISITMWIVLIVFDLLFCFPRSRCRYVIVIFEYILMLIADNTVANTFTGAQKTF